MVFCYRCPSTGFLFFFTLSCMRKICLFLIWTVLVLIPCVLLGDLVGLTARRGHFRQEGRVLCTAGPSLDPWSSSAMVGCPQQGVSSWLFFREAGKTLHVISKPTVLSMTEPTTHCFSWLNFSSISLHLWIEVSLILLLAGK